MLCWGKLVGSERAAFPVGVLKSKTATSYYRMYFVIRRVAVHQKNLKCSWNIYIPGCFTQGNLRSMLCLWTLWKHDRLKSIKSICKEYTFFITCSGCFSSFWFDLELLSFYPHLYNLEKTFFFQGGLTWCLSSCTCMHVCNNYAYFSIPLFTSAVILEILMKSWPSDDRNVIPIEREWTVDVPHPDTILI